MITKWYVFQVLNRPGGNDFIGSLHQTDGPGDEGNFDNHSIEITHRDWNQDTPEEVIRYFFERDGFKYLQKGHHIVITGWDELRKASGDVAK